MWQIKKFRTLADQQAWIEKNEGRCQIVVLFIANGFGVEYRKLRFVY